MEKGPLDISGVCLGCQLTFWITGIDTDDAGATKTSRLAMTYVDWMTYTSAMFMLLVMATARSTPSKTADQ